MTNSNASFEFHDVAIDRQDFRVRKGQELRSLTPRAFDVLVYLIENRGRVVPKEELFERVWNETFVTDNALSRSVKEIRRALDDDADQPRYIETVPKRGYRFIAEVRATRSAAIARPPRASKWWWAAAAAIAITVFAALAYVRIGKSRPQPFRPATIAVLPFRQLGDAASDPSLGVGIADDLITRLSNARSIVVRPTTAILKYAGRDVNIVQAGRDLHVDAVLTGTIQRSADRIRVAVQLVAYPAGTAMWGHSFEEKFTDLFALQDAISQRVTEALAIRLSPRRTTEDVEAFEAYQKGRYHWSKRDEASLRKAIGWFEIATARDPSFAAAYAGLADCYNVMGNLRMQPPREAFPKAKAAALKALSLDGTLAEAHASLAFVMYRFDWDWNGAEREYKRAIELKPNYATAHLWYGNFLGGRGRLSESEPEIRRALSLDPTSPIVYVNLGIALARTGRLDDALRQLRKAIDLEPAFALAHLYVGTVYERKGDHAHAVEEYAQGPALAGHPDDVAALRAAFAKGGWSGYLRKEIDILAARAKRSYVAPLEFARAYASLGTKDEAFAWLEKAYDEHAPALAEMDGSFFWDPLRGDPRFASLRSRVNSSREGTSPD